MRRNCGCGYKSCVDSRCQGDDKVDWSGCGGGSPEEGEGAAEYLNREGKISLKRVFYE